MNSKRQNVIVISRQNLDLLYVDNTFEEVGNEFPSREKAMEQVLKIVRYLTKQHQTLKKN